MSYRFDTCFLSFIFSGGWNGDENWHHHT